jgi:hypothetical protein
MRLALPAIVPVLFAVHVSGKAKPQFQAVISRVGFAVVVLQYAALFQQFLRRFLKPLNGIMHRAGYLPRGGLQEKRAVISSAGGSICKVQRYEPRAVAELFQKPIPSWLCKKEG